MKLNNMIIYKVTNLSNGKVYIGKTVSKLSKRKAGHYNSSKRGSETNFHRALRAYPENCFKWEILAVANDNEELNIFEIKYIEEFDSYKNGYNMTCGGDGGVTFKKGDLLYERVKHKFSNWKNGNPGATPEAIKKRIETFKVVKWVSGEKHGNYGHRHNVGIMVGEKNPMYGKTPTNARMVIINGITYKSVSSAARELNTYSDKIRKLCLDINEKNYNYI
jgi:group I intron endonuclease